MKKIQIFLVGLIFSIVSFAQTPESFTYQAIVRDNTGQPLPNSSVTFHFNILQTSVSGTTVYSEEQITTTNDYGLVNLQIGQGTAISGDFTTIDWGSDAYFLNIQIDLGSGFVDLGTQQFVSVPYALYSKSSGSSGNTNATGNTGDVQFNDNGNLGADPDFHWDIGEKKLVIGQDTSDGRLIIQQDPSMPDSIPILEVKNKSGQTVFVVYPDSVHIFINDTTGAKGALKGGFAVSGRSGTKSTSNNYLSVTPDSTRIYFKESGAKGVLKGGFAVSGRSGTKIGNINQYFNVSGSDTAEIINPSEPRIVWYPIREALLSGRVLVESADSVGTNSFSSGFESKSIGDYSQALGYKARAYSDNSTAIGYKAEAIGKNSFAFGDSAKAIGLNSISIGSSLRNFKYYDDIIEDTVILNAAGPIALGNNSLAIGYSAYAYGSASVVIGAQDTAFKPFSIAIGRECKARDMYCTVVGGYKNDTYGWYSFVGGGQQNKANGQNTTVVGGFYNQSLGNSSSIFGGTQNTASGQSSCITGGDFNNVSQDLSFIGGGNWNTVSGSNSSIVGGAFNVVSGRNAAVLGGYYNEAHDSYETVIGHCATIGTGDQNFWNTADRLFVIGNGTDWSTRNNAMVVLKSGEVYFPFVYTTAVGATNTDLYIDNTGKIGFLSSSKRFKKDINNMEDIDWLYKLRPVNYIYKTDNDNVKQYGLIAEEVEKINPLFVAYSNDGTIETVQYSKLISPMLKAIQEQKMIIEQLQKENNRMKAHLDENTKAFESFKSEMEKLKKYQVSK